MFALLWLDTVCFYFLSKVMHVNSMLGMFQMALMR